MPPTQQASGLGEAPAAPAPGERIPAQPVRSETPPAPELGGGTRGKETEPGGRRDGLETCGGDRQDGAEQPPAGPESDEERRRRGVAGGLASAETRRTDPTPTCTASPQRRAPALLHSWGRFLPWDAHTPKAFASVFKNLAPWKHSVKAARGRARLTAPVR